jgi:hypothetical protein
VQASSVKRFQRVSAVFPLPNPRVTEDTLRPVVKKLVIKERNLNAPVRGTDRTVVRIMPVLIMRIAYCVSIRFIWCIAPATG